MLPGHFAIGSPVFYNEAAAQDYFLGILAEFRMFFVVGLMNHLFASCFGDCSCTHRPTVDHFLNNLQALPSVVGGRIY